MKKTLRFDSRWWCRRFDSAAVVLSITALLLSSAGADETIRRVQEELRKRHLYFGDIDGRATPEIQAALKRYQQRKGFAPTGIADSDTAHALGIPVQERAVPPGESPWPEEPVLRSEVARNDRAFLEQVESVDPAHKPDEERPGTESVEVNAPERPGSGTPESPQEPVNSVERERVERARRTLENYLAAAQGDDPDAEMAFYGNKVSYFDHGLVDRTFIRKDIDRYRQRWPKRDYKLLGIQTRPVPGRTDEVEVRFRLQFAVSNGRSTARGITDNAFRMQMAPDGAHLLALREHRVRN